MDPQYLLKDEVEFELACRGYVHPGGLASALKLVLKKMLHVENLKLVSYELKAPSQCSENPSNELDICSDKLDCILRYVSELKEKPDKQLYKRLVSRLIHVMNRLKFIEAAETLDKEKHKALSDKAIILLNDLEAKDDMEDDDKITKEMKEILQKSLGEDSHKILNELDVDVIGPSTSKVPCETYLDKECTSKVDLEQKRVSFAHDDLGIQYFHDKLLANVFNSTSVNDAQVTQILRHKLVPISQWGVQFSGDTSVSVNAFIERVNELKYARNATDEDLWRHAIDFFKGDALIWFRANREYIENWNELVILLKRNFQSPYYQEELLAEAKSRTQGSNESVVIYVSAMQNLFNRLPNKISEMEKIMIIIKNLQPYYQRAVCRDVFSSISDLINVLRILERTKINCDNFKEPKSSYKSMEPDLAYKSSIENNHEIHEVKALVPKTYSNKPRCWNCRESGHLFRSCAAPKQRLFCYRCGRFGITSKECNCMGNEKGEGQDTAN
ncbi:unnamed protein product [Colias eurytheme]|nr:unnamed protein product [Colias eurytheme]